MNKKKSIEWNTKKIKTNMPKKEKEKYFFFFSIFCLPDDTLRLQQHLRCKHMHEIPHIDQLVAGQTVMKKRRNKIRFQSNRFVD